MADAKICSMPSLRFHSDKNLKAGLEWAVKSMHVTDLIEPDYKSKHAYQLCMKCCLRAVLLRMRGNAGLSGG
jgi:hypothetical protein